MTIYFNDLSLLATMEDATHIDGVVAEVLLQLLGWRTSSNPKKQQQFSSHFSMLGVCVDLSSSCDGFIKVGNKPSRVKEVSLTIESMLRNGTMTGQEASSFTGKLSYMDAQHHARLGIPATRALDKRTNLAHQNRRGARGCTLMGPLPSQHAPTQDCSIAFLEQVVILSDGAVEGLGEKVCSMGAVAFFPRRGPEFFSATIPDGVIDSWREERRKHVIYQTEMFLVVFSIERWKDDLAQCPSIHMIDNEAVRHSFIAARSRLREGMRMLWHSLCLSARMAMRPWFARVPSQCNLADGPSRGNTSDIGARKG